MECRLSLESRSVNLRLMVCILLLTLGPTPLVYGKSPFDGWVRVESEHFIVLSNEKPKAAQQVAEHFEMIRSVLIRQMPSLASTTSKKLLVFSPRNEKGLKLLLPWYWEDRDRAKPAGVFQSRPEHQLIVARADLLGGEEFSTVYHEYFHYMTETSQLKLPPWASEGLAELWGGGTNLTSKHAEVARARSGRLRTLINARPIPLEELFAATRSSQLYRDKDNVYQFYAQSWALTHMMLFDDQNQESQQAFARYLLAVGQGADSLEAAREHFGDLEDLKARMKSYARRPSLRFLRLELPPKPARESLKVEKLSKGETAAYLARYLSARRQLEDLEKLVATALDDAPGLPMTLVTKGQLHVRKREIAEGIEAFAKSIAAGSSEPLPHYGIGALRFYQALSSQDGLTGEVLVEIEQHLLRALAIDPGFAPALSRLARVYRLADDSANRALMFIQRGVAQFPHNATYRLTEAEMLFLAGEKEASLEIVHAETQIAVNSENASLNNIVCWDGLVRGFAKAVMPACERIIALDPEHAAGLDSRGVARLLTGDLEGALADFRHTLALREEGQASDLSAKRDAWIKALEAGENPLTERGYRDFATDPVEQSIDWLH